MGAPAHPSAQAAALVRDAAARGVVLATAESCTGGLVAGAITDVAGSSAVFDRGWVTYSNAAKSTDLDVDPAVIEAHGAVSAPVAAAMAVGARRRSRADVALSITGIAGPDGGTPTKPVGLVWFGVATAAGVETHAQHFDPAGGRAGVRHGAVRHALALLYKALGHATPA